MRLRVRIKNSKDCRIELPFPDLSVKYNNGYAPALKIKEGEEIPLDVLDPEDVRKSLKVGSLQGYLSNGWIEEFTEDLPIKESFVKSQFITEQMALAPKIDFIKKEEKIQEKQLEVPTLKQILPEAPVVEQQPISVSQNEAITDITKVFSYDDFCRLSHFLKLRFIKETENLDLLRDITDKTPSSQIKNNIHLRLSQIKVP